jgi:CRP/FNR family transcriptional regulator, anaerobic regulatory protein
MILGNGRPNGQYTPCAQCPLRRCSALRAFTAAELAFVQELKADELRVDPGVSFLREGSSSEYLYTVLSGWAFRYKMLADGRRQILNYALPADLVGLQGSLMREMEHSVEALTPLTFDITWLAAREEQLVDENLLSVGRRSALERTAYLLLHLFVRAQEVGLAKGHTIQFPFTQQHLADTLGMSLVHTNKTLKRLTASNAIRWKDRVFEVNDRAALERIAGDDGGQHKARPFI